MARKIVVEEQPSQTLAKGLLILEVFSSSRPHLGIRELARELDLNPATVMRLVSTLENAGYLEQDLETQRYRLGPMLAKLGSLYSYHNPLPALAEKIFDLYKDRFAYNFYLGILKHYEVIYLAVLDGRGPIKIVVEPGGSTGLHSTALGKMLLASQSDEFIRGFLANNGLRAHTARTITHADELWSQIDQIRAQGYAVNNGEHFDDVAAVGAPVYDHLGHVVAGVSLAYPRLIYLDEPLNMDELIALTKEIAARVTAAYAPVASHK